MRRIIHIISIHKPSNIIAKALTRPTKCPFMLIITLLLGLFGISNAAIIRASIVSQGENRPLAGASLVIQNTRFGSAADNNGIATIFNVPGGEWTLSASFVGYFTEKRIIKVAPDDTLNLSFILTESVIPLDEIVYTATRAPQLLQDVPIATEVVTNRDIKRRVAHTAAEALESSIGLDVQEDFAGSGITLQGADPNKVLILIDGRRMIGRVNGSLDLDQISTSGIKQIEIVKGAMSTLYGSEAIGGVVNIITQPALTPFSMVVDFSGGGYLPDVPDDNILKLNRRSLDWTPGLTLGIKRGSVGLLSGTRFRRIGLIDIDPSTSHTEGVDATDRLNQDLRLDWEMNDEMLLTVAGRYMTENKHWVEDGGLVSVKVSYDDEEINSRTDLSTEFNYSPSDKQQYQLRLYSTSNYHMWEKWTQNPRRKRDFSGGTENFYEISTSANLATINNHTFNTGLEVYRWKIESEAVMGSIISDFSGDLSAVNAYVQDTWTPNNQWSLVPGIRYEYHEIYGAHWSPRLSSMFRPVDGFKARASVGWGYRAPSSKELYFVFNHAAAGYVVYGNEDLVPETSRNYSLSFEYDYEKNAVSRVSFFYNDMRNLIDFDSLTASEEYYTGIYRYENIKSAWAAGVEIERSFSIADVLEADLAYIFMSTRNRETDSRLMRRPTRSARWNLTWKPGHVTVKVWGRYTGKMLYRSIWSSSAQVTEEYTTPHTVWNINLLRNFGKGWSGFCKFENIFDEVHPKYGPYKGRVLNLGVRWEFNQ